MEGWGQVESLFHEALQQPVGERDAWLRAACGSNVDLHRDVASLLANHRESAGTSPWAIAAARLIKPILLEPGQYVGHYQIVSFLAAGGMGEVYRSRDTKLKRDVALKVLPEAFARDPSQMVRFQREAEVLASLNHPNIAHIYGIEERALVMEFVEGESLERSVSFEEAANIALQIADALEYAHERGVVHRDLKPANIRITPAGKVKLLDFGLARAFATESEFLTGSGNSPAPSAGGTEAGVILGTAAYMPPEQASGKQVDKRSDIWSYGVVLWELLTGKRLFDGETVSHTLANVLRAPIDFTSLPEETPRPIRALLERCLDRDVRSRLRDIGEARITLQKYLANFSIDIDRNDPRSAARDSFRRPVLAWSLAGVLFVSTAVLVALTLMRPAVSRLVSQFTVEAPPGTVFSNVYGAVAVSPDGRYLVFGAASGSERAPLWLRALDAREARPLPGTDGANVPFWSPDSKSVAFVSDNKLKRLDLQGGGSLNLCDVSGSQRNMGGAWNRDGVILFGGVAGLRRVPASGGEPVLLTKTDASRAETGHGYPQFMPDGKHFLYFIQSGDASSEGIYISSLDHPQQRVRIMKTNTKALYTRPIMAGSGYLLWLRNQTLWAQLFDDRRLRLQGDPVAVVQDIAVNSDSGRPAFWASDAGLLVFRTGGAVRAKMAWFSRDGKHIEGFPSAGDGASRLSPDGQRAVFSQPVGSARSNLWLFEFSKSIFTRLTFGANVDSHPVWSPDGRQIAFSSDRSGIVQIYRKGIEGSGQEEELTGGFHNKRVTDWSRDGKYLLYSEESPKSRVDMWALPLGGERKPIVVLQTPSDELKAQFSPDGKWIAYESDESGAFEVYIRAFPSTTRKWQISNQGGTNPRWRADGRELFYLSPVYEMMAVTVRASGISVQAETPGKLFRAPIFRSQSAAQSQTAPYDVAADGQRFLLVEPEDGQTGVPPLTVFVNWDAGLKK
jgi:serine/threonine protein kinase/Tol biopolymer transport system component